jgi:hypothetical protein
MTLFGRKDMWQADWAEQERLRLEAEALKARRPALADVEGARPRGARSTGWAKAMLGRVRRALGR